MQQLDFGLKQNQKFATSVDKKKNMIIFNRLSVIQNQHRRLVMGHPVYYAGTLSRYRHHIKGNSSLVLIPSWVVNGHQLLLHMNIIGELPIPLFIFVFHSDTTVLFHF